MLYKIGIGMYDCTGPAAEQTMMGYADSKQKTHGIADRQWVRAFVIKDQNNNYLCFAVADICMVFNAMKNEVVKRLSIRLKGVFNADNILISATHTHSGPAGYSYYPTFNISSNGFSKQTFEAIVNGYVQAIIRAWNNLIPGKIYINSSELFDCGGQRSREAWESNPLEEQERYGDTDKSITLLKFVDETEKLMGTMTFFALHPTSIGITNHLISADNRGYASRTLERIYNNNPYSDNPSFIAVFPNANGADVSPNVGKGHPPGGEGDYRRMQVIGEKLVQKTIEMLNSDAEEITGEIKFGQTNIDLANVEIEGTDKKTCDGAFGASFSGASSEDNDSPIPLFVEGLTRDELLVGEISRKYSFRSKILTFLLDLIWHDIDDPEWVEAQGVKPILLPVGRAKYRGMLMYPHIFPFQIVKLGSVSIAAFPGEMTSMAGIRLKNTILQAFQGTDVKHSILVCYANSYSNYTTTREEYSQQHYEGASTLFGPNQLEAIQQEYRKIAELLRDNKPMPKGIPYPKYVGKLKKFHSRMRYDDDPMGKEYGDMIEQPNESYNRGNKVMVKFIGANPRNNLKIMDTFLKVQRKINDNWETVYRDLDFETKYHWKRQGIAHSVITIDWNIPKDEVPGEYRIVHNGNYKSRWLKKIIPYIGISNSFEVKE